MLTARTRICSNMILIKAICSIALLAATAIGTTASLAEGESPENKQALATVIGEGRVFFGSSVDGTVYALTLEGGQPRWSFDTEGPIRFAPALWRDSVLAASDDGFLYALRAADGKLLWKHRGGPDGSFSAVNKI